MDKGVVIVALGHPNYLLMAVRLISTLRYSDKEVGISLIHDNPAALNDRFRAIITTYNINLIQCPHEYYHTQFEGQELTEYAKAKTYLYQLSPYERTIYVDADSVWFKRPISQLFAELESEELNFQCRGRFEMQGEWQCLWNSGQGGLKAIREHWKIKDNRFIYETQSSFIYFKKGKIAKKYFETAAKIYEEMPIPYHKWGGGRGIPDELPFNIATAVCKVEFKTFPFTPLVFWDYFRNRKDEVFKNHYGLSMAGSKIPTGSWVFQLYEDMVKLARQRNQNLLRTLPVSYENKSKYLAERKAL